MSSLMRFKFNSSGIFSNVYWQVFRKQINSFIENLNQQDHKTFLLTSLCPMEKVTRLKCLQRNIYTIVHITGVYSGICPGGWLSTRWGLKTPLKSIDFTGPRGGLAPIAPPTEYASGTQWYTTVHNSTH